MRQERWADIGLPPQSPLPKYLGAFSASRCGEEGGGCPIVKQVEGPSVHSLGPLPGQQEGTASSPCMPQHLPKCSKRSVALGFELARVDQALAATASPGQSMGPTIPCRHPINRAATTPAGGADEPPALAAVGRLCGKHPQAGVVRQGQPGGPELLREAQGDRDRHGSAVNPEIHRTGA